MNVQEKLMSLTPNRCTISSSDHTIAVKMCEISILLRVCYQFSAAWAGLLVRPESLLPILSWLD
uniref:Uncharacterized protein n=1 Tax=Arion vulgaris TaxID=1028688 RepID=A0A0B6ZZA0_9EUPU